ncbi:hypothetical protein HDU97_005781 [Phlyctochytrium planicorne]|nr:hypothetical protein HDU97_005781 [Phlyctochytrium planicorne]
MSGMEVDITLPQVPFVPGGLRSLVSFPLEDPAHKGDKRIEMCSQLLDMLELYFCNKEMRSILAQARNFTIPGAGESFGAWVSGWVPLAMIASFKSVKSLKVSIPDILDVIQTVCPSAFEISPDGSCIRRAVAFEQPLPQEKLEMLTRPAFSGLIVEVTGAEPDVTRLEIKEFFESFGKVRDVTFGRGGESGSEHAAFVDFEDPQGMVKALAGYHVYEETPLRLRALPRNNGILSSTSSPPSSAGIYPSLYSVKAKTEPIKTKGNAAIQPSAILGYPLNRILKVGPIPEDLRTTASIVQKDIEKSLSSYGPISEVVASEGSIEIHIRFKMPIASEVEGFLRPTGGLEIQGDVIPAKALSGEEERIYHEVKKAKDPPPDMIPFTPGKKKAQPPTPSNKYKAKQAALARRSQNAKKKTASKASTKMETDQGTSAAPQGEDISMDDGSVLNQNNKRPATSQDDAFDELVELMGPSPRKIASSKKVKVEHIDSMFKSLTSS